jgi:aspartate carbamoyltransferase catalytic subunit
MFNISSVDDLQNHLIGDMLNFNFSQNIVTKNSLGFLFFQEPSTRTKESFRIAFSDLQIPSIDIISEFSSVKKGETFRQTLETLANYKQKTVCVWRGQSKIPLISVQNVAIINAGDGANEHPTQALGDLLTISKALNLKFSSNFLKGVNIAIIGDIENSRVARSNIKLLTRFGANIALVSSANLLSRNLGNYYKQAFGCEIAHELTSEVLTKCQFLMFLRMQSERASTRDLAIEKTAMTPERMHLLPKNSFILHPGPVNIGSELCNEAFSHSQSLINEQVQNAFLARKFLIHKILDT